MAEDLTVQLDSKNGAVVTYGPVVYVVWRNFDDVKVVEAADEVVKNLSRRFGDGRKLFYCHRTPQRTTMGRQNPEVRDAVLKHFERTENLIVGAAVAIEATGFPGSIIRSATAAVLLVRNPSMATKTFADARDGVRWLGNLSRASNPFDFDGMVRALERSGLSLGNARSA